MKRKIKVCHVTSVHPRFDIRIFIKECVSLYESGFDVSLIVADGLGDELVKGVMIYDVGKSKNRLHRILFNTRKIYKKAKSLSSDIYHFHDPELMFYGLKLKGKYTKVVYDIHEDLVQQIKLKYWIPKSLRNIISILFKKIENFVVKRLDALVVPQPYMKKKYLLKNKNTVLVANFVILENTQENLSINYANQISFHGGALTKDRGVLNMIKAYALLKEENKLILAGNLKEELLSELKNEEGWNNITYLGRLPYEDVKKQYLNSSIGLILYNNVGQYYLSYAIKLFEYMLNGIPVIMPNFGEWVAFNKENQCGINVDSTNAKEVAAAINYLNENIEEKKRLGKNGRTAVLEKYNWSISENTLIKLYNNLQNN